MTDYFIIRKMNDIVSGNEWLKARGWSQRRSGYYEIDGYFCDMLTTQMCYGKPAHSVSSSRDAATVRAASPGTSLRAASVFPLGRSEEAMVQERFASELSSVMWTGSEADI